jgi:hypothetical protein
MRWCAFAAMALVVASCADVAGKSAGSSEGASVATFSVRGYVVGLLWGEPSGSGNTCQSNDAGYGEDVVVRDADTEQTLGLGHLGEGVETIFGLCEFWFEIDGVPEDRKFYSVTFNGETKRFTRIELNTPLEF